ncbi:MAG: hypothetical protein R3F55_15805 [Alphaproteobacteria bacterium]
MIGTSYEVIGDHTYVYHNGLTLFVLADYDAYSDGIALTGY